MKKISLSLCLVLALALMAGNVFAAPAGSGVFMGTAIRSLENPYHGVWARGAQAFADSVGGISVIQTCEGSSEKQLNDIKALVAKAGKNAVFCIDPRVCRRLLCFLLEQAGQRQGDGLPPLGGPYLLLRHHRR